MKNPETPRQPWPNFLPALKKMIERVIAELPTYTPFTGAMDASEPSVGAYYAEARVNDRTLNLKSTTGGDNTVVQLSWTPEVDDHGNVWLVATYWGLSVSDHDGDVQELFRRVCRYDRVELGGECTGLVQLTTDDPQVQEAVRSFDLKHLVGMWVRRKDLELLKTISQLANVI